MKGLGTGHEFGTKAHARWGRLTDDNECVSSLCRLRQFRTISIRHGESGIQNAPCRDFRLSLNLGSREVRTSPIHRQGADETDIGWRRREKRLG